MRSMTMLALLMAVPLVADAQDTQREPERTVTVSASATVEREPERSVLLLAVESTGSNARTASQANATKMDAVNAALRRVGIPARDIRTVNYELQPEYEPQQDRPQPVRGQPQGPRIIGYRVVNMVQVTVDTVARTGGVIDAAIAAGANRVANLSYELRNPQAARLEALRAAVEKARGEANVMAEAVGQRLGPPLNITTSGYAQPRFAGRVALDVMQAEMAAPTPIEPGMMSVNATVNITFRLVQ